MKPIRAKPHRLSRDRYRGLVSTSFTACLKPRRPFFTTSATVEPAIEILRNTLKDNSCSGVYCFMPDHVHVIVTGTSLDSDTFMAFERFKQQSGWWLKKNTLGVTWQEGFHDRILRNTHEFAARLRYVLNNPVRANLMANWADYAFSGGVGVDLKVLLSDLLPY